jgi:hypothetical protein
MTAGHGARHHANHVMPAIHVVRGRGRRFMVTMLRNRALIRGATGGLIGGPHGAGERRVQQDYYEQTDACGI